MGSLSLVGFVRDIAGSVLLLVFQDEKNKRFFSLISVISLHLQMSHSLNSIQCGVSEGRKG